MDLNTARALPKGTPVGYRDDVQWSGTWRGVDEDDPTWCWVRFTIFGESKLTRNRVDDVEVR